MTLTLCCQITCGSVAANINALPLSHLPHISLPLCGCCGVQYFVLLCVLVSICSYFAAMMFAWFSWAMSLTGSSKLKRIPSPTINTLGAHILSSGTHAQPATTWTR